MGIDHKAHECPYVGDLPVFALGSDGLEYPILIKNVRYSPTFKDSLISINQLWLESKVDAVFKDVCALSTPCGKNFPFSKPHATGLYTWIVMSNSARVKQQQQQPKQHDKCTLKHSSIKASLETPVSPQPATERGGGSYTSKGKAMTFNATHSSKSVSHVGSLAPDLAAQHMHRRLHIGSRRMNLLPTLTADAPANLARAKVGSCPHCVTANATLHAHKADRYVESSPGRLIHADIAGPFIKSAINHHEYLWFDSAKHYLSGMH